MKTLLLLTTLLLTTATSVFAQTDYIPGVYKPNFTYDYNTGVYTTTHTLADDTKQTISFKLSPDNITHLKEFSRNIYLYKMNIYLYNKREINSVELTEVDSVLVFFDSEIKTMVEKIGSEMKIIGGPSSSFVIKDCSYRERLTYKTLEYIAPYYLYRFWINCDFVHTVGENSVNMKSEYYFENDTGKIRDHRKRVSDKIQKNKNLEVATLKALLNDFYTEIDTFTRQLTISRKIQ